MTCNFSSSKGGQKHKNFKLFHPNFKLACFFNECNCMACTGTPTFRVESSAHWPVL
jgi:hypothetical protein